MGDAAGASGSVPALPEYPNQTFIAGLPPQEWRGCLELWIYSVEYRLRQSADAFKALSTSNEISGFPFLSSYLQSECERPQDAQRYSSAADAKLRKHCHLLLRRLCLESSLLYNLEASKLYDALSAGSTVFKRTTQWPETLQLLMKKAPKEVVAAYGSGLDKISQNLSSDDTVSPSTLSTMRQASSLISAAPEAGVVFMTGNDYLDILVQCYGGATATPPIKKVSKYVTEHTYICLRSLMKHPGSKMSMLLDHLYGLRAAADVASQRTPQSATLLSSLVCLTTLLRNLEVNLGNAPNARGQKMHAFLREYRQMTSHLHPPAVKSKNTLGKGKGRAGPEADMHMHKASQMSQIHDLFPNLPASYVLRLLDYHMDNVEQVIGALLEPDSLPPNLRTSTKEDETAITFEHSQPNLAPRLTPPLLPQKNNVFDNDDFDNLRISPAKLHRGRKDKVADFRNTEIGHNRSKAAIMAALAAFDSDDDERDDTYDVADVGGTVDDTLDIDERNPRRRAPGDPNEQLLFSAWKDSKELFARDSKTRLSQHRQQLKTDTGWTDEQIEGWGLMLRRDPAREDKLQQKHLSAAAFGGKQISIERVKWAGNGSGTATEEEDSDVDPNATGGPTRGTDSSRRIGTAGIRGARTFGAGRGGSTAGPASMASTQTARKRKEQGRGRGGANHNRRDERAKKTGRGMAALSQI